MNDNKYRVVGVRFKKAGKIYYFDPQDFELEKGSQVIVETARGIEFGDVVVGIKEVTDKEIVAPLKKVVRMVTEEDIQTHEENKLKEQEAFEVATEKIAGHNLDMKLVDVEFTFDKNKIIFYFTADGRIDFRELVKDLASVFKTRIELRQIGVRDEAKMIGGIGPCGKSLCCATWLGDFDPVTIKMAKEQNLSLNPTKISGICGRLFCCLRYEHEHYHEAIRQMPAIGSKVKTEEGIGEVVETVILGGKVKVKLKNPMDDVEEIKTFFLDDITPVTKKKLKQQLNEKKTDKEVKDLEDKK
ncbi:MAG: stage 0 sporulation protein [Tindallia sp. MSAO_Bac2]|nr:MAG: stage 0 sporulation protein [Tindallia sp. MSAO_Bac2]